MLPKMGAPSREVTIFCRDATLAGTLSVPLEAIGLVIFAHGSGSSRHSPRNQYVAEALHEFGCATLLMDLLTERESEDRRNLFDIGLLGQRVVEVTQWAAKENGLSDLPIGYFGASTGAGAALVAAAAPAPGPARGPGIRDRIKAVVSRGGRPDLAGASLPDVAAPTLLLVGSLDDVVIELNRQAQARMKCVTKLSIIPGATHLFEEPGTLERVAREAGDWFARYFGPANGHG
jgi:putative phosphoribosyl transferase